MHITARSLRSEQLQGCTIIAAIVLTMFEDFLGISLKHQTKMHGLFPSVLQFQFAI